ncbi:MAG: dynamin family protein [Spirochaetaceae bacterium]|nr:dynamin family protein [Spirochaetaceae bacterium]
MMSLIQLMNSLSSIHFILICCGMVAISCFVVIVLVKKQNQLKSKEHGRSLEEQKFQVFQLKDTVIKKDNRIHELELKLSEQSQTINELKLLQQSNVTKQPNESIYENDEIILGQKQLIQELTQKVSSLQKDLQTAESLRTVCLGKPDATTKELMENIEKLEFEKEQLLAKLVVAEKTTGMPEGYQQQLQILETKLSCMEKEKKALKVQLEDAEDEIEDLEDEIEKKSKKFKEEYTLKEQELNSLLDAQKRLQSELEEKTSKLMTQGKSLELKEDTLGFVRGVLSAQEVSDSHTASLYEKVDNIMSYIKEDLSNCIRELFGDVYKDAPLLTSKCDHWGQLAKKNWLMNKRALAFVGEFSAGKTSIVNNILSQDADNFVQLPVSTKATTAIPTYISAGKDIASYRFLTPDNKLKILPERLFKAVNKDILDEVDGVSSLIKYFVMTCNNPRLSDLSILDTPGFSSQDEDDAIRTVDVINECDALFWVFDVNVGTVNKDSLKIIKEKLDENKPLYIVINKTDTKAPGEVDKVETLVRDTFEREGRRIQEVIRYNKSEPIEKITEKFMGIKPEDETDYLDKLCGFVDSIFEDNEKYSLGLFDKMFKAENDLYTIKDNFEELFDKVLYNCETARSYTNNNKKRLFSKEIIYTMTEIEKNELERSLNNIVGSNSLIAQTKKTLEKYEEALNTLKETQEEYHSVNEKQQQLKDCIQRLKKHIEKYKTVGGR